jgi:hypothetical protein
MVPLKVIRHGVLAVCLLAGVSAGFVVSGPTASADSSCVGGSLLNVVAHEDDDLLFMSPDVVHAVQAGWCVRTVVVTAGDAGRGAAYWQGREAGSESAYAVMAGVANSWSQSDAGVAGHPLPLFTLNGNPRVSLVFMRLPDGNENGSGFAVDGSESLMHLWQGDLAAIHPLDGAPSYSKVSLVDSLTALMASSGTTSIRAQDYLGSFGGGDHSDHYASADFAYAAQRNYSTQHMFTGYRGYGTESMPVNVSGADLIAKQNAFYAYAAHDPDGCTSSTDCPSTIYWLWFSRQYIVGSETWPSGPVPGAPGGVTATAGNAQALVQWTAAAPNGSPVTNYRVTAAPGGATVTVSGTTLNTTVSGLTNGTTYTFTVTATNVNGTGPASSPSNPVTPTAASSACPATIAGFKGEYFANITLAGAPVLCRDDASVNFNWGSGSPSPSIPADNFSARWSRTVTFSAGTYSFTVGSDDGSRLYIDGNLVIDRWVAQAYRTRTVQVALSAGPHEIRLEYFEATGSARVTLSWR